MFKKVILATILLCAFCAPAPSQPVPVCGTVGPLQEELVPRFLRNKKALSDGAVPLSRNIQYVPVTFHLVGRDDGAGQVSPGRVMDMLCALNVDFEPVGIQFYIHKITQLTNTAIYSDHNNAGALMLALRDNRSINVWLVQDATPAETILESGIVQGYYTFGDPLRDWIVMRNSAVNGQSTTLTHEMGHFFSLLHPFRGWDTEPYDPDVHGVPAPGVSPGGAPTERMSGINCETAADMLCDTPPDYNSGFGWETCDYAGALDPEGVPIDPEEKLFMSYFGECPREEYFFSDTQQDLMMQDLLSPQRTYLRDNLPGPDFATVDGTPLQLAPAAQATVPNLPGVTFQWSAVPGADRYLLEVDITVNYTTPLARRILVSGTSRTVTTLQTGRTYYWRVRPLNNFQTCTDYSPSAIFFTGEVTGRQEIDPAAGFRIGPNPVRSGENAVVNLTAYRPFQGSLQLLDLTGRMIREFANTRFSAGSHPFLLDTRELPAGIYFLSLQTEEDRLTRKVVVTDR